MALAFSMQAEISTTREYSFNEHGFYGFSLGFFLMHLLVGTGFQPAVGHCLNP